MPMHMKFHKNLKKSITLLGSSSHDLSDGQMKDFGARLRAVQFLILVVPKLYVDAVG